MGDQRQERAGGAAALVGAAFARPLCAIDDTEESLAAVTQAGALAGPDGHLTLLVATSFRHEGQFRGPQIPPARASKIVEAAQQAAIAAGVSAGVEVDPGGAPSEVIARRWPEHDLLALGAAASATWLGAMFMDSVTALAEENLTTPLLVARNPTAGAAPPRRLVIASDGLDGSDGLVEFGARLAERFGAETVLVHILGAESQAHPHRIAHQAERLKRMPGSQSEVRIEPGTPRNAIVDAASGVDADLIVMSSRRVRGLRTIGSVSRPVVAHAHCSVLLMPPELLASPQAD